jgi:cyclopropane-fatty-acyl-phospholipid synthase
MKSNKSKTTAEKILALAGIQVNGSNPWDIKVHDDKFYDVVLSHGSLGLGESYMDGWWDCETLDELFLRILSYGLEGKIRQNPGLLLQVILASLFNMQSRSRAFQVGERHYDLDNELFQNMLDRRMNYSCGYWNSAQTLDQAQENKLDLICRKLGLRPGMKILDIGCGWGGFASYAAEKYRVKVTGITVSREQLEFSNAVCSGLPVEIRLQDYRALDDTFDHVVSVGMFEHVGYKNYREYMRIVHRCLKHDGLFLLHTIGGNKSVTSTDPWINKYIFPNGMLPSIKQIGAAIEGLFVMEDWHNFSADYDTTFMAWHSNFERSWPELKEKYSQRFYRMWKYYLLSCAGSFRARSNQLWQIVLSKNGVPGGYTSLR